MKSKGKEMKNKYEQASDEDLARWAQEGDREAEDFLLRAYKHLVKSKARSYFILGGDGEDVIQEAMIGLFKAIGSYSWEKSTGFKTYAHHCINNQIYDAIKAAQRKKHEPLNQSLSLSTPAGEFRGKSLQETLENRQGNEGEVEALLAEINTYVRDNGAGIFTPLEQSVWKGYMAGKSFSRMAKELDKKEKAVYNALNRTKTKITRYLYKEG